MTKISLRQLLDEVKKLEPIPAVASQILTAVDKPGTSMQDIANVIQYDPMITAGVLKTCNSAYFALKNPVESIKDAVNLLGVDQVIEVALMKSGVKTLSGGQKGYGLDKGDMWKYSISSAVIAKQVAKKLSLKNASTIYTAALLKDVGKIILEKYVGDSRQKITQLVDSGKMSFLEAEKKVLGVDHAELGALIVKEWNFSARMVKIIRYHHLPEAKMAKDAEIVAVYLADCICMMMGIGVGADGLSYRFKDQVMKAFGLSANDISLLIAEFGVNMQKIEALLTTS